jgi:hypothetical protein
MKFVSDIRQVVGFLWVLRFHSSWNKCLTIVHEFRSGEKQVISVFPCFLAFPSDIPWQSNWCRFDLVNNILKILCFIFLRVLQHQIKITQAEIPFKCGWRLPCVLINTYIFKNNIFNDYFGIKNNFFKCDVSFAVQCILQTNKGKELFLKWG